MTDVDAASLSFGILSWITINFIIAPYAIYWLHRLWQYRHVLIIRKRKPGLLILFSSLFIIWWFISTTSILIFYEGNINTRGLAAFTDFINLPTLCVTIGIALSRWWLIFYMINYNRAVTQNQWQSVIHPKNAQKNWYICNQQKYGTWRGIRKWVIALLLVQYFMTWAMRILIILEDYSEIAASVHFLVIVGMFILLQMIGPLVLIIYMQCNVPLFEDDIGIREELKTMLRFVFIMVIIMLLFTIIIATFMGTDWIYHNEWTGRERGKRNGTAFNICAYIFMVVVSLIFMIMGLKSTRWPLKTFASVIRDSPAYSVVHKSYDTADMIALVHENSAHSPSRNTEQKKGDVDRRDDELLLRETFLNKDMMDAFMEHLFVEYCAECLLSVIEFTHFKQFIKQNNERNRELGELDGECTFDFCKSVPQSQIVYGTEDASFRDIAKALYQKYIATSAVWEINIDYASRKRYIALFGNEEIPPEETAEFYYTLFDDCIDVMIGLINPSFSRFKSSQKYKMIAGI